LYRRQGPELARRPIGLIARHQPQYVYGRRTVRTWSPPPEGLFKGSSYADFA
jgi:hypothetical protein